MNKKIDPITVITMCRRCLESSVCEIRQVIMFYQPIQQDHPDPNYTHENIFKAGRGECPLFRAIPDEEDE